MNLVKFLELSINKERFHYTVTAVILEYLLQRTFLKSRLDEQLLHFKKWFWTGSFTFEVDLRLVPNTSFLKAKAVNFNGPTNITSIIIYLFKFIVIVITYLVMIFLFYSLVYELIRFRERLESLFTKNVMNASGCWML